MINESCSEHLQRDNKKKKKKVNGIYQNAVPYWVIHIQCEENNVLLSAAARQEIEKSFE